MSRTAAAFACLAGCLAVSPGDAAASDALLTIIDQADWHFTKVVQDALPPVQVVQREEREHFSGASVHASVGGDLRLYVTNGGGRIFAFVAHRRLHAYRDLESTRRFAVYEEDPYVVVVPVRPIAPEAVSTLASGDWTAAELTRRLGAPSFRSHTHGVGCWISTYVPQGLRFIGEELGPQHALTFQLLNPTDKRETCLRSGGAPSDLDYSKLQDAERGTFASEIHGARREIDRALAQALPSPSGRFRVGHVNVGRTPNTEEVVIGEKGMPERRYRAGGFLEDGAFRWIDGRTVVYQLWQPSEEVEFRTIDAVTGERTLADTVRRDALPVTRFDAIAERGFWYETGDGVRHEVQIPRVSSRKPGGG